MYGRLSKILSLALMALFFGYLGCIALFTHVHQTQTGSIVHSHPYSGSAKAPGHSHTAAQMQTIEQLSALLAVVTAIFVLKKAARSVVALSLEKSYCCAKRALRCNSLRAPPVC